MFALTIKCSHCKKELTMGCLLTEMDILGAYDWLYELLYLHTVYTHNRFITKGEVGMSVEGTQK